ncbi:MAG: efflux RND transporter periplasmic adaptor subunit [Rhodovibrionaceae bacterium]
MQFRRRSAAAMAVLTLLGTLIGFAADAGAQDGPPAIPVEVAPVSVETVLIEVSAVGTLLSNESVVIRPEIAGLLTEISFAEGANVTKGDLLFGLEDSIYQAELEDSRARLLLSQRNYERARDLYDRGAGTARSRDEAEAELRTTRAAVELATARLEKTQILAPISGVVGLRHVSQGDYVEPGEDLVNLEDIESLKVDFSIPERYLANLRVGQRVQITVDAFPGEIFTGEVYASNPQINVAGRSIEVRARIDNAQRRLRPGLFVRVNLEIDRREDAIVIPEQALVPRDQDIYVYKVVDGTAVQTKVETGQRKFGKIEVLEGLAKSDIVVVAGQLKLTDGAKVKPVTASGTEQGQPGGVEPGSGGGTGS